MGMCKRDAQPCTAEHLQGLFCIMSHDGWCRRAGDPDNSRTSGSMSGKEDDDIPFQTGLFGLPLP